MHKKIRALVAAVFVCGCGSLNAQDFHGYDCTQDCSGHEAGYRWAELHDITDPDECSGDSESFYEGCVAYAEEQEGTQSSEEDTDECDEDSDDCP